MTGTAIAAVLFGDTRPGRPPPGDLARPTRTQGPGTTPATYPGTRPNGTVAYDEGRRRRSPLSDDAKKQEPRFPFGHGLSYTAFAHGSLEATYDAAAKQITVEVTVTNTGRRSGTEVLQVYATLPASAAAERAPPRRLPEGHTSPRPARQRVSLKIPARDLTVWKAGALTLVPGAYTFATARSSRALTAQRTLTLG
ncbi:beta-glucosidase OS=Streptomyces alboniger OX=132473 GN=CP975_31675 PE=3 SV=1 [Streptomyces alboniger]